MVLEALGMSHGADLCNVAYVAVARVLLSCTHLAQHKPDSPSSVLVVSGKYSPVALTSLHTCLVFVPVPPHRPQQT